MNPLLRASVVAVLALASLDVHAAVRRTCVTTLAVQPGNVAPDTTAAPPKKPCLVAVAYAPSPRGTPVRRDARERGAAAIASAMPGARA